MPPLPRLAPQDPERFVELDPETPATLLDQRNAGKQLVLITNSDFQYTEAMMQYAFNRFLPAGMTWRDLFSMVIVQVRRAANVHQARQGRKAGGDGAPAALFSTQ